MDKRSNIAIALAVVAVVVASAVGLLAGHQSPSSDLGGITRLIRSENQAGVRTNALTYGDVLNVASGSKTLLASEICDSSIINWNADGFASNSQAKFPSATNLINRCLPNKGDVHDVLFINTSRDEKTTLTAPSGNGLDILLASRSGTAIQNYLGSPNQAALVKFWNVDGSSVSFTVIELTDD